MYLERAVSTPFLKRLTDFARTTVSGSLFQVSATLLEMAFSLNLNLACCHWILKVFPLVPLSVPTMVKIDSFFIPRPTHA